MQKDQIKISKVRLDKVTTEQALEKISAWLKQDKKRHITTPNPEILLKARKNHKYLTILNRADLNIADGTGLIWAAHYQDIVRHSYTKIGKLTKAIYTLGLNLFNPKKLKTILPERVTGTDLMQKICQSAQNNGTKIYLLGAEEEVAKKAARKLEQKYPGIIITGTHSGSPAISDEESIVEKVNNSAPEVLFVAYGAPQQEIWISRNLQKLKTVKIAMGVGGAFDFISGHKKRAPKWMRKIGLEWLYRLIKEPSRKKRIYNATIKFPTLIIKKSLKS